MNKVQNFNWQRLLIATVLLSYFYVFMEWVFFATKPSFMSDMSAISKAMVFFSTSGIAAFLGILATTIFYALSLLLSRLKIAPRSRLYLATAWPSAILTILALILLDNFTYTVFGFGVVTLSYLLRGVYAAGFILLLFYFARWLLRFIGDINLRSQKQLLSLSGFLSIFSILSILGQIQSSSQQDVITANINKRPNILIIGSDGVNAENMSVYDYERSTTPTLEQLSAGFLVAENAFTNGGSTTISVVTLLTGKISTQTHFMSRSSILMGEDAHQHLPGILHRLGYYSVQLGVPYHVDSYAVNLQDGFDVVNGRSYDQSPVFQIIRNIGLDEASYFLSTIFERASSRMLHIFYMREMENPMEAVTNDEHAGLSDPQKVAQIIELVKGTRSPIFIHTHLMGTHGPIFNPAHRVFSLNEEQDQDWMGDFYDDAILDFDAYIKEVMDALAASGKLDNTILVIYTDHNMLYRTNQRIPLMIRFPKGEWAGRVGNDVQNIDIAPTILDYLGIDKPSWMNGQSFLRNDPPQNRLIFSGDHDTNIRIVQCNRWYSISVLDGVWSSGEVIGHTTPCEHLDIVSKATMPAEIGIYLAENQVKIQDHPDNNALYFSEIVTRGQIASILLQKKYGTDYTPPPARGLFTDVSATDLNIRAIEQIYLDGIIDPCSSSPLSYCPDQAVTREEAAVFLLKTVEGSNYQPPLAKGIFADVPATSPFAPWVEELHARGITSGCNVAPLSYCPTAKIIGEHLTVFINRAFSQP